MAIKTKYLVGDRYKNNNGRWFTIYGYCQTNRKRIVLFDSGCKCEALTSQIRNGKVTDYGEKTYYNIASAGMKNASKHPLFNRWINMVGRCYNKSHCGYKSYGAKGVTISDELLNFKTYVDIVEKLPNYSLLSENPSDWDIDKDLKSKTNKIYSPNTLCIIKKKKNIELENSTKK